MRPFAFGRSPGRCGRLTLVHCPANIYNAHMPTSAIAYRLLLPLLALALWLTGCIERTITITSEPSGSLVHLNDEEVGRTPLTVPFTFYGVYDVRLEHEATWLTYDQALVQLGVEETQLNDWIVSGRLDSRPAAQGERREVKVYYQPLWTQQRATAPWWDNIGPDVVAEALPNQQIDLPWHFRLQAIPPMDPAMLIQHAKQMRAKAGASPAPLSATQPASSADR